MPIPFGLAKSACQSIAILRNRVLKVLCSQWSKAIEVASAKTTSVCPSLGASITDSGMDEQLAHDLVQGKLSSVTAAHTALHELLGKYGVASRRVSLAPRIQEHPLTRNSVALALHSLSVAQNSVVAMKALHLLRSVRHQASGPSQMEAFLAKVPQECRDQIPKGFWVVMDSFAMESAGPAAASSSMAPGPTPEGETKDEAEATTLAANSSQSVKRSASPGVTSAGAAGPAKLRRRRK